MEALNHPGPKQGAFIVNSPNLAPMDQSGQRPYQYSSPSFYESATSGQQLGVSEKRGYNGQHGEGQERNQIQPEQGADRIRALEKLVMSLKTQLDEEKTEKQYYKGKAMEFYQKLCMHDPAMFAECQRRAQATQLAAAAAANAASSLSAPNYSAAVLPVLRSPVSPSSAAYPSVRAPSALFSSAKASAIPPSVASSSTPRQTAVPSVSSSSAPRQTAAPAVTFSPDPREKAVPSATRSFAPRQTAVPAVTSATHSFAPRQTAVPSVTTSSNPRQTAVPSAPRSFAPHQTAVPSVIRSPAPSHTAVPAVARLSAPFGLAPHQTAVPSVTRSPAPSHTAVPAVARLSAPLGPVSPVAAPPIFIDLTIDKSPSCSPSRSQKRKRTPEQESDEGSNARKKILAKSFDWMKPKDRPNFQKRNPYQPKSTGFDTESDQYDHDPGQARQESPLPQSQAPAHPPESAKLSDFLGNQHSNHRTRKTNTRKRQETAKTRRQDEARERLKTKKKQIMNATTAEKSQGQEAEDYEAMGEEMEAELEKEAEDVDKMAGEMEAEDYKAMGEELEAELEAELEKEAEDLDKMAEEMENWLESD